MKRLCKRLGMMALAGALLLPGMPGVPAGTATVHAATVFPDVTPQTVGEKVQRAIEALAAQGIIRGFPDGTFGPNRAITRAQFAKILAQVQNLEPKPEAAAQFTDISDPEQKGWVGALVAAGLTTGTTPTTFSPNQPIQRDQFATFLVRALGAEEIAKRLNKTPNTKDGARISDAHRANVALLMDLGLMGGFPDGTYGPAQPVKRQQAASVLYDLMQNRARYEQSVRQYGNDVRIRQQEDGTLSVEGFINGAAEVDVTLTDEKSGRTLLDVNGIETSDNGRFSVRTEQRFLTPATVKATVVGYDENGNELAELSATAQVGTAPVKGVMDGPDLLQVEVDPKDGKRVRFIFDESIRRVEEPERFFLITADGTKVRPERVEIDTDDRIVVARMIHEQLVATATIAGVQAGAVIDQERTANVPYSLPLQDVTLDGKTVGPELEDVTIKSFKFEKGKRPGTEVIRADFTFNRSLAKDLRIEQEDAQHFGLVLKDGTVLKGTRIHQVKTNQVTVDFDLSVPLPIDDPEDRPAYIFSKRYFEVKFEDRSPKIVDVSFARDWSRDEIARAFVEPGVVRARDAVYTDQLSPNPFTVIDTPYGRMLTNELYRADLDMTDGELKLQFKNNLESLIGDGKPYPAGTRGLDILRDDLTYGITLNLASGEHVPLRQIEVRDTRGARMGNGYTVEVDKRDVIIEFDEDAVATVAPDGRELTIGQILALTAGVTVQLNPWTAATDPAQWQPYPESELVALSSVPIQRHVNAGTTAAPVLEDVRGEYDNKEGALIVTFTFSHRLSEVDESRFLLYTPDGDWFDADRVKEINRDTVVLAYDLSEDEANEVVLVVVDEGAVRGDRFLSGIANPPASMPFRR